MADRRLLELWGQLQGKKPHFAHFLTEIRLANIRGITDLRVLLDYPVSVIAGGNASGKTTVLLAAACAYSVPGAGVKAFVPSTLFPDYRPRVGGRGDERLEVTLDYDYSTPEGRRAMRWRRGKSWNRSFFGRKGGSQPERPVYLRTLSNLTNPSEVRGVLGMSQATTAPDEQPLTALQIDFAQKMLPFRYSEVIDLTSGRKNLLFAAQEGGAAYSELHMAAGERAILRLSQEIAQLRGALVLIDEVEAGLHPWVQQLLMLQLQELALRNDLQVVVTTHSPIVLDAVPLHGRIFLERADDGSVLVRPPYRDVVQSALYGRSGDALNVLCEDEIAEAMLHGVCDRVLPAERIRPEAVRIGRDTGADEFPMHAAAFRKFGQIDNFVFVLDGDRRDSEVVDRVKRQAKAAVPVLFLPGREAPECWVWERLESCVEDLATPLGIAADDLRDLLRRQDQTYASATDRPAEIAKAKLRAIGEQTNRSAPDVCRHVAAYETDKPDSQIQPLVAGLRSAIEGWRAERGG